MHGDNTFMFKKYAKLPNAAIYPWSLDIVDCFFLINAFKAISKCAPQVRLIRRYSGSEGEELLTLNNAYDLYDVDTSAYGSEVVLIDVESECSCYWDIHERFVIVSGTEAFINMARPYPEDIQRHRYIESMSSSDSVGEEESAELIYDELVSMRS